MAHLKMGVDVAPIPLWRSSTTISRTWKFVLVAVLTLLVAAPLLQLSDHAGAGWYYKQYIYENLSKYLGQDGVYNNTLYQEGSTATVHAHWNFSNPCNNFPDTEGILLVMKTGASETFEKIPTHLLTSMQCLPDLLMFSDKEQQIGKYHLYNALDRVDESVKKDRFEFNLYNTQLTCPVSQKLCTHDMAGAWELDKYKFLNMLVQTWEKRPYMTWYVFAEADTYVVWPNLVQWLRTRADPIEHPYVGSVAFVGDTPFAHGGSGYVISGEMVKKMVETIPDLAAKYDGVATEKCCGDLLMSMAVREAGSRVAHAHPMFNGEKPNTLPYGPGHWCEPIFTMHHMDSEEVSAVWQYEQTRTNKEIIQIKDMYQTFFAPKLLPIREDWDNLSEDVCYIGPDDAEQQRASETERARQRPEIWKDPYERRAHLSASDCARVCETESLSVNITLLDSLDTDEERDAMLRDAYYAEAEKDPDFVNGRICFQWRYRHGICCTGSSFKLGVPRHEEKDENRWTSGWFVRGINDWIESKGECDVEWKDPERF